MSYNGRSGHGYGNQRKGNSRFSHGKSKKNVEKKVYGLSDLLPKDNNNPVANFQNLSPEEQKATSNLIFGWMRRPLLYMKHFKVAAALKAVSEMPEDVQKYYYKLALADMRGELSIYDFDLQLNNAFTKAVYAQFEDGGTELENPAAYLADSDKLKKSIS